MRKLQFFLIALVMFQFSCETPEETNFPVADQAIDQQQVSADLKEMFSRAFRATESLQLATVNELTEKQAIITLEVDNINRAAADYLEDYFELPTDFRQNKIYPLSPSYLFDDRTNKLESLEEVVNYNDAISDVQKSYILSLASDIMEVQNYQQGFELIHKFKQELSQKTTLTDDEKLLLLEMYSASEALIEFVSNSGISAIEANLGVKNINPTSRAASCSIDWRSVWIDGVVGLASGAVYGGYIGATAGTFTVPVLGTVAGGVGGAVFGGASGFFSGVTYGIVGNLVSSCTRSTVIANNNSCDSQWDSFSSGTITTISRKCFEVKISL